MMKKKKIYALGFFDGVHLGHQALLHKAGELAREQGAAVCAVTFDRHPQSLFVDTPPKLINETPDRVTLLKRFGAEDVLVLSVTEQTMAQPWDAFLTDLVEQGAAGFVCGSDFRFGCKGAGNAEKLSAFCAEKGLAYGIVEQQMLEGVRISSTHIRQLLESGQIEKANAFLGHPHMLTERVVTGRKLGRTIGIPTANLQIPEGVIVPKFGVYACKAVVEGEEYPAVTNIGTRPTVGGHRVTVEPYLLDFSGDLYGKTLSLSFYGYLRPEQKFNSLEELKAEIEKNALQVGKIFEKS